MSIRQPKKEFRVSSLETRLKSNFMALFGVFMEIEILLMLDSETLPRKITLPMF